MTQKSLPRGLRNNNPLNIRLNPANRWQGKIYENTDGAFEQFTSIHYGIRAAFKIVHNWLRLGVMPLATPAAIVSRWAPPSENNTRAYIERVGSLARLNMQTRIRWADRDRIVRMVHAMAIVENGAKYADYLDITTFNKCYEMA